HFADRLFCIGDCKLCVPTALIRLTLTSGEINKEIDSLLFVASDAVSMNGSTCPRCDEVFAKLLERLPRKALVQQRQKNIRRLDQRELASFGADPPLTLIPASLAPS